jgi:hypothetical protein
MTWVHVVHALPGRTRLRSPKLRKDTVACELLADVLTARDGVREVRLRPYTGSALVLHAPEVASTELAELARTALALERVLAPTEHPPRPTEVPELSRLAKLAATAFRQIDREVKRASEGSVDLGTLVTGLFFGAGALQLASDRVVELPPWFNLAWWGYRTFMTNEQQEIDDAANE